MIQTFYGKYSGGSLSTSSLISTLNVRENVTLKQATFFKFRVPKFNIQNIPSFHGPKNDTVSGHSDFYLIWKCFPVSYFSVKYFIGKKAVKCVGEILVSLSLTTSQTTAPVEH